MKRLKDDKNLWPPYYLVPVVRKDALDANPKIAEVLNRVNALTRRADDGRDELQGRRREGRAQGRRPRVPEGEGRRPLTGFRRHAHDAHAARSLLTGAGVTIDDVVRVARSGVAGRARPPHARAWSPRARSSIASRNPTTRDLRRQFRAGRQYRQADCRRTTSPPISSGPCSARAVGVGPRFATDVVRAMMFARAAGMAVGGSGRFAGACSMRCIALLNAGVHPVVPSLGSDRRRRPSAAVASLRCRCCGEGVAEYRGEILPGAAALERAGLQPVAARRQGWRCADQRERRAPSATLRWSLRDCVERAGCTERRGGVVASKAFART